MTPEDRSAHAMAFEEVPGSEFYVLSWKERMEKLYERSYVF
jgi:hypothetical protein